MINNNSQKKAIIRWLMALLLLAVFVFKAYLVFWQYKFFGLLVAPSPDLVPHAQMADHLLRTGNIFFNYPPLFHIIIARLSLLISQPPLATITIISPYLLLLAYPAFYWFVRKIYGFNSAFWATTLYILVSSMPLYNLVDAQYPDILGYSVIGPVYFMALIFAIRKRRARFFLAPILLFIVLLSTHHLSAVAIWAVSVLALALYPFLERRGKRRKFAVWVFIFSLLSSVFFTLLALAFYKDTLVAGFHSLVNFKPIGASIWTKVQDYTEINQLLAPMLEFIGFAGLLLLLKRLGEGKRRFGDLLLLVWVSLFWLISRFNFIALPTRILRELSLPLSVLGGIFLNWAFVGVGQFWKKALIGFVCGYLIVINVVQITAKPFLIPPGISVTSWYRAQDEQKYQFISKSAPAGSKIIANYSNPILNYKLKRAGFELVEFNQDYGKLPLTQAEKKQKISDYLAQSGADYLFIGEKPKNASEDIYFAQFSNYHKATETLRLYEYSDNQLVKLFNDGSRLILLSDGSN